MTNPNALDDLVLRPLWRLVLLVDESQAQPVSYTHLTLPTSDLVEI